MSDGAQPTYLTTDEAGKRFPIPITAVAVLHRMNRGVKSGGFRIKLECVFDGRRFLTTQEWIDEFIQKVTEARGKSPVVERLDTTSVARFKALIRRK